MLPAPPTHPTRPTPHRTGEAAVEAFVPRPDLALEELRLLEVDVRTFAQGEQAWCGLPCTHHRHLAGHRHVC